MKARHTLLMTGLICCSIATGWADDRGFRGHEPGRRDWHGDDHRRHGHHHHRHGRDSYYIQPYGYIQPYLVPPYGGVRPYPYSSTHPPSAIVPPPPSYWYCPDPSGYYPYVQYCRLFWERVPAH